MLVISVLFIYQYEYCTLNDGMFHLDALMKAICTGKEGFHYVSRALVVLLQTLLQDGISEVCYHLLLWTNTEKTRKHTARFTMNHYRKLCNNTSLEKEIVLSSGKKIIKAIPEIFVFDWGSECV